MLKSGLQARGDEDPAPDDLICWGRLELPKEARQHCFDTVGPKNLLARGGGGGTHETQKAEARGARTKKPDTVPVGTTNEKKTLRGGKNQLGGMEG